MSSWDSKLLAPVSPDQTVLEQVHRLFGQQRETWDLFRNGEAALNAITTKRFSADDGHVTIQANPGRSISTNAKVDPQSIAQRPCFLCAGSLPPEERGVAFGDYIILPNPFPILRLHVTIAYKEHSPQQLAHHISDLFALAKALGPDMFVLYNGPRCGASAPDHLHFQACSSSAVPLFDELPPPVKNNQIMPRSLFGRNLISCSFRDANHAAFSLQSLIAALQFVTGEKEEPMCNIIAYYRDDRYIVTFFPRAKHRSASYFAEPEKRLSISPAAVEMAGIVVVADIAHFDRVDAASVRALYEEVTLDNDLFSQLVEAII